MNRSAYTRDPATTPARGGPSGGSDGAGADEPR